MSDTPTTPTTAPPAAQPRRKRGARFWLVLTLSMLAGLPILLFLAAWAVINLGFLDNTIAQRIAKRTGMNAHIGALKTDALQNFSVQNLVVDSSTKREGFSIGSAKVDFGLMDLFRGNHIRGVTIERPDITVSYDPKAGWKPALKFSPEQGEGMRIDRFDVLNGTFTVNGEGDKRFKLLSINAAFGNGKDPRPGPFSLSAALESGETISADGSSDAHGGFNGRVHGGVNLERDAAIFSDASQTLRGLVRYDFKTASVAPVNGALAPQQSVDGIVNFQNFICSAAAMQNRSIALDKETLQIKATAAGPSKTGETFDVSSLKCDAGKLGTFETDVSLCRLGESRCVNLSNASGNFDLGAVDAVLKPGLLGEGSSLRGAVQFSKMKASFSTGELMVTPSIDGHIQLVDITAATREFGELPPIDFVGDMDRSSIKNASLKLGELGSIQFDLADIFQVARSPFEEGNATIRGMKIDIGKFAESPLGQKLFNAPTTAGALPPYQFLGTLTSPGVEMNSTEMAMHMTGLMLSNLAMPRWPFAAFNAPDLKLSGALSAVVALDKSHPKSATLLADLTGMAPAAQTSFSLSSLFAATPPKCGAKLRAKFAIDDGGAWHFSSLDSSEAAVPLSSVGNLFRLKENFGVRLDGGLRGSNIQYTPARSETRGSLHFDGGEIRSLIPQSLRDAIKKALVQAGKESFSIALDTISEFGLKRIGGDIDFLVSHNEFSIKGNTTPISVFGTAIGADFEELTLPSCNIEVGSKLVNDGQTRIDGVVEWDTGRVNLQMHMNERGVLAWAAAVRDSTISESTAYLGGTPVWKIPGIHGPLNFSINDFKLSSLGMLFQPYIKTDFSTWGGRVTYLSVDVEPFPLDPNQLKQLELSISWKSATLRSISLPNQGVNVRISADRMTLLSPLEWSVCGKTFVASPQEFDVKCIMKSLKASRRTELAAPPRKE